MLLSIIIVSYNTKELTLRCISSIFKNHKSELEEGKFEIIVVDNNSSDGSVKEIQGLKFKAQRYAPVLKIVKNSKNLGFAKGCNIGAREARGKYILFLNSDTELLDRGIKDMISYMQTSRKCKVTGGKLIQADGSTELSAGRFYNLFYFFVMILGGERLGLVRKAPETTSKVDWVSGGMMMVEREYFLKLNGFDENFFMYVEDMEFCFRVARQRYETVYFPAARARHLKHGSADKAFALSHIYKGLVYFYAKHKAKWQRFLVQYTLCAKALLLKSLGNRNYAIVYSNLG